MESTEDNISNASDNLSATEETINKASVSDQATEEDALGFEPYVTAIEEFLTSSATKPPLTLSIEGEWGSGKSSFMKQLKKAIEEIPEKELKQERNRLKSKGRISLFKKLRLWFKELIKPKPKIVWFNAWRHDKAEALWATFSLEFIRQISRPRDFRDIFPIIIANIKLFLLRFNWSNGLQKIALFVLGLSVAITLPIIFAIMTYYRAEDVSQIANSLYDEFKDKISINKKDIQGFLRWFARIVGIIISVLGFLSLLLKLKDSVVGDPINDLTKYLKSPNYHSQVPFVEKLHEDFRKIVEAYAGKNKVYVFIDDLDRCEVPKSADLMQAINLMISDDQQIIFILGMDREKVAAGIALKFKELIPYLYTNKDFIPYLYANNETSKDSSDNETSRDSSDNGTSKDSSDNKTSQETSDITLKHKELIPYLYAKNETIHAMEYAYNFMDKFIQLPFLLPQPIETDIEEYLKSFLSENHNSHSVKTNKIDNKATIDKRVDDIKKILGKNESKIVRDIGVMIANALGNNPRRLKQFINVFRLQTIICASKNIFEEKYINILLDDKVYNFDKNEKTTLTLEQLGKFIAISLKWPRLLIDLDTNAELLKNLQEIALADKPDDVKKKNYDSITINWSRYPKLIKLLQSPLGGSTEPKQQINLEESNESLYNLDIDVVKKISIPIKTKLREADIQEFGNNRNQEVVRMVDGSYFEYYKDIRDFWDDRI